MAVLSAALCVSSACAWVPPEFGEPGPQPSDFQAQQRYEKVRDHFSDHQEVYIGLDTQMFAAATYQSLSFREERVKREALFHVLPQEVVDRSLATERAAAAESYEFLLGVYVRDPRFDDFDRQDSIWRIWMVTPEGEASPTEIHRIGRATVNLRAYYPYLGDFWVAYRLRFPKTVKNLPLAGPTTTQLTVRVASTLGKAELRMPLQ